MLSWPAVLKTLDEVVHISVLSFHCLYYASQIRPVKASPSFFTLYSVLFFNSFSSYLKEVWIVSSTCSIASFTCKWNYKYLTNMWCKKETWISRYVPPTVILSVFCLFRKTSLLFFLSLSAFVHVRRHFSNWPRKYMQRAWGKSATHFLTGWQKLRKAGAFAKCLDSDENLKP